MLEICRIYINLEKCDGFCLAVLQDGRSYSASLFEYAQQVLGKYLFLSLLTQYFMHKTLFGKLIFIRNVVRIGGGLLVGEIADFALKVGEMEKEEKENQKALEDAPEEFLDPIMSTLMIDPVILPSSKVTVDRTTIARHLLSDQTDPFNREPLTMDQVKSDAELKGRIDAWIRERKSNKITNT